MKKYLLLLWLLNIHPFIHAQLYIAPGDSMAVLPGTIFTLQENLENNGRIFNGGTLTLNGSVIQNLSGGGVVDNLTADNNAALLNDITVNYSLLINPGKIFDINSNQLASNGNINGAGFLKGSPHATILLNGSGNSVLQFDQSNIALSNALKNITIAGSSNVSFQNKLYVYGALLPNAGSITLADELVLRSNDSTTARVGIVGSTVNYAGNGKFVIERYIPGNRAWRLLTAPVTTASKVKISEAWQDNAPRVTNVSDINGINNPNPGFGTHVTFGFPAINGYDQGINGNTSIRYLVNTGWNAVPTATNDGSVLNSGYINDQPGYLLFVRGDRSTLLSQATAAVTSPAILRPKGKINIGAVDHPITASYSDGFGATFRTIGNPYASPVNFHSIATNPMNVANGFADAFYIWDPNITGSNGVGGFVGMSYNAAASLAAGKPVYDRTVLTSGSSSIDDAGDIQSSAAFLINYSGPATSLRIEESNKSSASNNSFFRPANQVRTSLLAVNNDNTVSVNDGILQSFDAGSSEAVDNSDLRKISNFTENISVKMHGLQLSIERRQPIKAGDTIFYHVSKLKQKRYQLEIILYQMEMAAGVAPFLEDAFLKTNQPVSLNDTWRYDFTVTSNTASADSSRFRLIFKSVNNFISIAGRQINKDVKIDWVNADTFSLTGCTIERSDDNILFTNAGIAAASINDWWDVHPAPGIYYYRIKTINKQGVISYSDTVKVVVLNDPDEMYVFPNPVINNQAGLHIKNAAAGMYQIKVMDNAGKVMQLSNISLTAGTVVKNISLLNRLSGGVYTMQVTTPSKAIVNIKILVHRVE